MVMLEDTILMIQSNVAWTRRREKLCRGWASAVVGVNFAPQRILAITQLSFGTSDLLLIVGCESWCESAPVNAVG